MDMAKKANLKRENKSLLTAAQNNAVKDVKVKIHKSQEISKCRLCRKRDKTVSYIVTECKR